MQQAQMFEVNDAPVTDVESGLPLAESGRCTGDSGCMAYIFDGIPPQGA